MYLRLSYKEYLANGFNSTLLEQIKKKLITKKKIKKKLLFDRERSRDFRKSEEDGLVGVGVVEWPII